MNVKLMFRAAGRFPAALISALCLALAAPALIVACQEPEIVMPDDHSGEKPGDKPEDKPGENPEDPGNDTPSDPAIDTTLPVNPIDTVAPVDPGIDTTSGPVEPEEPHDTLGPDDKPAFTHFAIEGVEYCFISDGTLIVVLPPEKSLEEAEVTYTANVMNVAFRKQPTESGVKFTFEQGKAYPYQLTAEDGRTATYKVKAYRFDLPVLFIESDIIKSKNTWVEGAEITFRYPSGDTLCYAARVKGRGNSTWNWPKKPYTIGLEHRNSFFELPKHKRWNLMANWKDHTLIRNDVAFEVARRTDLEWTPSGDFVELILNGVHRGNYYLCEKIAVDKHRLALHELQPGDDDITGGYLLEFALDEYDEAMKNEWAGGVPYAFKSPKYQLPVVIHEPDSDVLTKAQYDYVYKYISDIEGSLSNSTKLINGECFEYIDIETFADWYLVIELTGLWEPNQPKSCYMYKDQGGKLKAGPVWDFDWSTFNPGYKGLQIKDALWFKRLLRNGEFNDKLVEEWIKHRDELYGVLDYILMRKEQLLFSAAVDKEMWPFNDMVTHDLNGDEYMSVEEAFDRMYDAYKERWEWMDSMFGE